LDLLDLTSISGAAKVKVSGAAKGQGEEISEAANGMIVVRSYKDSQRRR
jgi:hypothetical protein